MAEIKLCSHGTPHSVYCQECSISGTKKYPDGNPKTQYGMQKPMLHLIPSTALIEMSVAMTHGGAKYGPYNWRTSEVSSTVYIDAALRHLHSYLSREDRDKDSGAHHLGHVMACCAILLDAYQCRKLNDDRPPGAPFGDMVRQFADDVRADRIPAVKLYVEREKK